MEPMPAWRMGQTPLTPRCPSRWMARLTGTSPVKTLLCTTPVPKPRQAPRRLSTRGGDLGTVGSTPDRTAASSADCPAMRTAWALRVAARTGVAELATSAADVSRAARGCYAAAQMAAAVYARSAASASPLALLLLAARLTDVVASVYSAVRACPAAVKATAARLTGAVALVCPVATAAQSAGHSTVVGRTGAAERATMAAIYPPGRWRRQPRPCRQAGHAEEWCGKVHGDPDCRNAEDSRYSLCIYRGWLVSACGWHVVEHRDRPTSVGFRLSKT